MIDMLRKLFVDKRFLFLLVGGVNTAFSTALFVVLVMTFGPRVPSFVSLGLSWMVSLVLVFFAYRYIVFRVRGHLWLDFLRFSGTNVTALLINLVALTVLVDIMGFPAIPVQIGIVCFIVVFNYFGHKHISFRRK
jgi:putative flippase GtrA